MKKSTVWYDVCDVYHVLLNTELFAVSYLCFVVNKIHMLIYCENLFAKVVHSLNLVRV